MANTALLIEQIVKNGKALENGQDEKARQAVIRAANKLVIELENPMEQVARIGWGEPSRTCALRTAFELGLFKKLSLQEPLSSIDLARGATADPLLLARILKHLAAYGFVEETGEDQYKATPFSMASNHPTIASGLIYSFEGMIPVFHHLPAYLAKKNYQIPEDADDGPIQFGLQTDKSFFAVLQENARLGDAFNKFMTGYAEARPRWVDYYPCEEALAPQKTQRPFVVDVGGGLGHDLLTLHTKYPNWSVKLILQDTAAVINDVKSTANLPAEITPVVHDFFTPQPEAYRGAKAYFLRQVLHDWPDEKCVTILSHLRDAMRPGYSKILINEHVLANTGAPWQQTSLDWTMMAMLVSRERTESQWRQLLSTAGLKISGIWQKDPQSGSVIEAVLADD